MTYQKKFIKKKEFKKKYSIKPERSRAHMNTKRVNNAISKL